MRGIFALVLSATPLPAFAVQTDTATPLQDLDCAIWASSIAATTTDKEMLIGIATLAGYFIGRYEAAVKDDIDEAMFARSTKMTESELAALNAPCQARARTYGSRLTALGARIVAASQASKTS